MAIPAEWNRFVYSVDNFYWGMSNDEYAWPAWCVLDAEGVEIRRNSREITLNRNLLQWNANPVTPAGWTNAWEITTFNKYYDTPSTYTFFAWTANGKVYDVSARTASTFTFGWFPILTIGVVQDMATVGWVSWAPMTGQLNANKYGFLIDARWGLYRWTWTNAADGGLLGTVYNSANLMNTWNVYSTSLLWPWAPYIITNNSLIYGCANLIYVFDLTKSPWASATAYPIQVDRGYTIKGISKIDAQIVIYTANDSVINSTNGWGSQAIQWNAQWKVYYYSFQGLVTWNPPDRTIDWKDKPILWAANRANIDYVVTGSNYRRAFYQNNWGYSPTLLYQSKITTDTSDRFFFQAPYASNTMASYGNIILMWAKDKVYSYGSTTNGLPDAMAKEFDVTGYTPTCFFVDETEASAKLYIWAKKNSETYPSTTMYYYAPTLNTTGLYDYQSGWFVVLNPILWEWVSQKKRPVKFEVSYNLEPNTYLDIEASFDDGAYQTIGSTAVGVWYGRQVFIMKDYQDFYKFQPKITLRTSNVIKTPHLFSFKFIYDGIEDEMT